MDEFIEAFKKEFIRRLDEKSFFPFCINCGVQRNYKVITEEDVLEILKEIFGEGEDEID